MLKYLSFFLILSLVANGREHGRKASEEELIAGWKKTAEQAVEKKNWLKALQNYNAIRSRRDGDKAKYDAIGSHMNKIFWYCQMYYCLGEKKNYKEAKWYINQRVSRH